MNEPRNPYAPPRSRVADPEERLDPTHSERLIPNGHSLPPGRGAAWIGAAWRLLRAQPGMWAAALVVLLIAYLVLSVIPIVNIFKQLLLPFAYAGIAIAADEQRRRGTFELGALLGGFRKQPVSLLAVAGAVLLSGIVFAIVLVISTGTPAVFKMLMAGGKPADPSLFLTTRFWLGCLVGLALSVPLGLATYLAPQLIVLHDQPALTAMKMSLIGCLKNILPGLVFLLCAILLVVVSMIPLLLGLLISIPIMVLTNYTVYRDIFVEEGT
jgi:hypothetical protein